LQTLLLLLLLHGQRHTLSP